MTKPSLMIELLLVGFLCLGIPAHGAAQNAGTAEADQTAVRRNLRGASTEVNDLSPEAMGSQIRFSFEQADWKDVIPWFAEQAGFSLQPISDWPKGTFHLVDDSQYSVIEALDQLNHALRLRTPPYTLVRNRNMLVLVRADQQNYPPELIETVPVDKLDERGRYETMRCVFEFGELDCMDFDQQLQQLVSNVNRPAYAVFEGANQIHVRETGATLRVMRDLIMKARQRHSAKDSSLMVYRLKHTDADSFLFVARELLGIAPDQNQREDETLAISAEPLSDRLFVKGTQSGLEQFQQVASLLDVPPEEVEEGSPLDKPFFQSYPVTSDPKLAFDSLQTFLAGRDGVRMQQDEITGAVAVMGRKADHQIVQDTLAMIEGSNGQQFAIVQLQYAEPTTVILTLRSLWGQTGELDPQGPVLLGNPLQRTVIVRGTPTEVSQVKAMIAQLDEAATRSSDGPRTRTRVIPMDDAKRDEVLDVLEDYWPSTGRTNRLRLNLIMPEDRTNMKGRLRRLPGRSLPGDVEQELDENDRQFNSLPDADSRNEKRRYSWPVSKTGLDSIWRAVNRSAVSILAKSCSVATCWINSRYGSSVSPCACLLLLQQLGSSSGLAGQEEAASSTGRRSDPDYVPPEPVESIPGDEIEVKATAGGIVITSGDLDALDDLEDLIRQQMGLQSDVQAPTFFFLKHRFAEEIAGFLGNYFGVSGSDGGDGGVGGVVGGVLDNVMGGGSGDLLGGLLGGTDGLGGLSLLEGDVRFGTDSQFNTVYVTGATGTDLNLINEIIEILDQPDAPQELELLGQFRTIPIIHRDPEEVKQIIEDQLSDLIASGSSGEGAKNEQGNQQAQQMTRFLQQMAGGGEGGGGNASSSERPKARLGVDNKTSQLLVTGPEFIYKEVLKMVIELDKPQLSAPPTYVVIPNGGRNSELLKRNLKAIFGAKIEINDSDAEDSGSSSSSDSNDSKEESSAANQNASRAQQAQQEQARRQFFRELSRQRGDAGGGGRAQGGGGFGRGGGGGGRGGRGR
jgi:type II secretory pathway component GspD/PulD (secretin)